MKNILMFFVLILAQGTAFAAADMILNHNKCQIYTKILASEVDSLIKEIEETVGTKWGEQYAVDFLYGDDKNLLVAIHPEKTLSLSSLLQVCGEVFYRCNKKIEDSDWEFIDRFEPSK